MIPKTHSRRPERHCSTCTCHWRKAKKALPKFTRKKPIKQLVDGVMLWPGGREKDTTREARDVRRERIWKRDNCECQQRIVGKIPSIGRFGGVSICGQPLELHQAHIHHIRPRAPSRNDADTNQVTLCYEHHELYRKQPQWSPRKSA